MNVPLISKKQKKFGLTELSSPAHGVPVETRAEDGHDPALVGGAVHTANNVARAQVQPMMSVQVGLLYNRTLTTQVQAVIKYLKCLEDF